MFSKRERQFVRGIDANALNQALQGALQSQGLAPAPPTGPGFAGVGPAIGYGVIPKVAVNVYPMQDGHLVDMDVRSEIDQSSLVILLLLAIFFFPLAAIFGFLAYQEFEKYAAHIFAVLRHPISAHIAGPPPGAVPYPPSR